MTKLDDLLTLGRTELGKPYAYGSDGPNMFDCSGLMQFLYGSVGIRLPRTAAQQQREAAPVTDPVAGDLVFYGAPAHHVALYLGNGMQLAAPHAGDVVKIQPVYSGATYGRVAGLGNTTTAPLTGLITTPASWAGDAAKAAGLDPSSWMNGAKSLIFQVAFVGLGLALIGYGAWRSVGQKAGTP